MSAPYTPPLVHLPGTRLTPEVVLHRTLNKAARIKAVVVVVHGDDDTFDFDWSRIKTSDLAMAALLLSDEAVKVARGQSPETITVPDPSA